MGALSGLRVADLTAALAGPFGSMMLADMGAEVIKIERPGVGDMARSLQLSEPKYCYQGMSSYHLTNGRNKKSMTLDLTNDKGKEVFYDLVKVSDVVYDNFRPGVLERLKADYETLRKVNPRIISCSASGYGLTGPSKDRPAFDGVIQAYGGEMSITGEPGRPPVRSGLAIGDLASGVYSVVGILAALYARQTSGVGQKVDIAMLDCQVSLWNYMATMYLMTGDPGRVGTPWGTKHYIHAPYGAYRTKDIYVFLAIIGDAHWPLLVEALGIEELKNEKYRKSAGRWEDKEKIDAILEKTFESKDGNEWVRILSEKGIPCGPVNSIDRVCSDPQVLARNMVVEVEFPDGHKIKEPGNPIKLSGTPGETFAPPPLLGQNTRDILRDVLEYTDERTDELEKEGII